ncbi:MAG: membrane integrity-associated transporter subunit PqiC [Halomonas sp.]|nr:ABC-type transport auxiliary lipoprotein family protein [Halomonas sp.]MCC5884037.1 membrane integrity-associated transporter subunit PqiC [Halomonas sp.]
MKLYHSRLTWAALPVIALFMAGCQLVPERTPVAFYDLPSQPLEPAPDSSTRVDTTVRLATPYASGLLDGARIVVVPEPNRPQVYEGARWVDGMPQLLRDRLLDAFQDDGRLSRMVSADSGVAVDMELLSDLRIFHSEYRNGHPEAVIRLDVRLVDARSQRLVASQRFLHSQRAESAAIVDVVNAFGVASDSLAQELVDWTVLQTLND